MTKCSIALGITAQNCPAHTMIKLTMLGIQSEITMQKKIQKRVTFNKRERERERERESREFINQPKWTGRGRMSWKLREMFW